MKEKIRIAKTQDVNRILELFKSDPNLTGNEIYKKKDIAEYISNKNHKLFVLEVDKKIIGCLMVEAFYTAQHLRLSGIVVDRNYQERGYGAKLMKYLEDIAKKMKMELIWGFTEVNNKKMSNLFKKKNYNCWKTFFYYSKAI
jgi:N-acetylglutamate synthase-like GNAT family acetyltransferase